VTVRLSDEVRTMTTTITTRSRTRRRTARLPGTVARLLAL
jgi:hypothetical protein